MKMAADNFSVGCKRCDSIENKVITNGLKEGLCFLKWILAYFHFVIKNIFLVPFQSGGCSVADPGVSRTSVQSRSSSNLRQGLGLGQGLQTA